VQYSYLKHSDFFTNMNIWTRAIIQPKTNINRIFGIAVICITLQAPVCSFQISNTVKFSDSSPTLRDALPTMLIVTKYNSKLMHCRNAPSNQLWHHYSTKHWCCSKCSTTNKQCACRITHSKIYYHAATAHVQCHPVCDAVDHGSSVSLSFVAC